MEDKFVKRCQSAITDLEGMAGVASDGRDRARLLDKADGVRLAVSYLRDYPTADAALLAKVREIVAEARVNHDDLTDAWGRTFLVAFDSISDLLAEGGA